MPRRKASKASSWPIVSIKGAASAVLPHRNREGAQCQRRPFAGAGGGEGCSGRGVRAGVAIGGGRGAARVVFAGGGVPATGYTDTAVKHSVTGAGRAGKDRVRAMVGAILSLSSLSGPLDASDAL